MPTVRSLSFHATYRCRHAGACCSSNWPIPIEADRLVTLQRALANRTLSAATDGREPRAGVGRLRAEGASASSAEALAEARPRAQLIFETPVVPNADGSALLARTGGRCVFYDEGAPPEAGRCRVHAVLGHDRLPLACRQFPRVTVEDPRGVSVTLSHYCPTAAGLLEADAAADFTIVDDPPAFPASGEYVGLDARGGLPPLLRRDMLMDWDAWWECERLAVGVCAESPDAATALARLRGAVANLETWRPADGPLIDRVRDAFRTADAMPGGVPAASLAAAVLDAIPADIRPEPAPLSPAPADHVLRRLLAAHAFGSWHIYQGTGLRTWLRGVEAAAALIADGCSIRETDRRIRHLADPQVLGERLGALR